MSLRFEQGEARPAHRSPPGARSILAPSFRLAILSLRLCVCLCVPLQCDTITMEELELLSQVPNYVPVCAGKEWGFDDLLEKMWSYLDMKRIYTKPRGKVPDYDAPVVVPAAKCTIEE